MFAKWLAANDWDFFGAWVDAFTASDFATGLLIDLVVTSFMVVVIAVWDRRRLGTKWTLAVIAGLSLSVSVALAIYLVGTWRAGGQTANAPEPRPKAG
jgi:hypothetical protein